jgi:long-subunit acyl-CoA synthetase (AMP-forming)
LQEGFTVENGCLTPTFKMMRKRAQELYKDEIVKAYSLPKLSVKGKKVAKM